MSIVIIWHLIRINSSVPLVINIDGITLSAGFNATTGENCAQGRLRVPLYATEPLPRCQRSEPLHH